MGGRKIADRGLDRAGATHEPPAGLVVCRGHIDSREVLVVGFDHAPSLDLRKLSDAERMVLEALLGGLSNAAIAELRGTSVRTVDKQVARVLAKLGVRSRGELAARAARGRGG